ncbi:MAG: class II fructose-bisphosphate aldolase [Firmicutes bacterium]|nr:class II fructose-bisphosphate aldolase [Candidatus Fermentithermobacillaceae bacterium]
MLVSTKEILIDARRRGYAVPAFNITDLQSIMVIMETCEEESAPCLIEAAEPTIKAYGADALFAMTEVLAKRHRIPVALHLDHGYSFDVIMQGVRAGFSSVMFDGSRLPFDENVAATKKIVEICHACGVSVEAEIGHVGVADHAPSEEERAQYLTRPEDARRFAELTGVDFLAVAIGTAHGTYKFTPTLDLERLSKIAEQVDLPLVIHGGSSTPGIEKTPALGVSKVNVFTDLQVAIREKAKEILETEPLEKLTAVKIWLTANKAAAPVARDWLRKLGASGKA